MNYGFVIDNSSCIGCHACSTACKSEHHVPLGVNRTWVKYTETGRYPDARRSFQVTRCNHCSNPPCVRICPTGAMHQRADGIVDFDSDACIGCKGCLQACPYDAIYIDPDTHTAAKCNYCAHRVEVGVEPACVVVCPEHAIIAGDLDDPTSEISHVVAKNNVTVRKPEQGTSPKVFYIQGHDINMHPTATERTPDSFMWADVLDLHPGEHPKPKGTAIPPVAPSSGPTRTPQEQGLNAGGPIQVSGNMAGHMVQVGYNAQHKIPWHWQIPAYVVTKHIAGGTFMLLGVAALLGGIPFSAGQVVFAGGLAVLMSLVTLALLIYDLDRPDRFFYLLVRPQWRSWIARAAWILSGFSAVTGLWWALETAAWLGILGEPTTLRPLLAALSIPFGLGASIYTAFLFAQAEGRDLWQASHVPFQMTIHAVAFGAATLAIAGPATESMRWLFVLAMLASLVVTLFADLTVPQASELARRAAVDMTWGRYKREYWMGGIGLGHIVAIALGVIGGAVGSLLALVAAGVGMYAYNLAFVMAPQEQPNS
ncbi:MAG: polysulfide reductase NrfD [Alphaproteobacteria bacterium]|nr:polysulfide reductase NrfD [Alphaproteobacteria bacterium]MCB9693110.1 polysulfide reductase NrfD [Alphaproteobacteria bacterium]